MSQLIIQAFKIIQIHDHKCMHPSHSRGGQKDLLDLLNTSSPAQYSCKRIRFICGNILNRAYHTGHLSHIIKNIGGQYMQIPLPAP